MFLLKSNSYIDAESWYDLEVAFTESLKNSSLDEIILLLHTSIPAPCGWRSEYVRPVFYNRLDEVPNLLLSTAPSVLRTGGTLTHQQRPHVVATGAQPDGNRDEEENQKCTDTPPETIADWEEEVVTPGWDYEEEIDETEVNATKVVQDAYLRHLEWKQAAAKKIQAAYRRHLERKQAGAARKIQDAYRRHLERKRASAAGKIQIAYRRYLERKRAAARRIQATCRRHLERKRTDAAGKIQAAYRFHLKQKSVNRVGIDAIQTHYWRLLRERSVEMEWSKDSQYHLLFRVPLGYILVCLDVIKAFAESERKEVIKRMMTGGSGDLEESMETLDQCRCGGVDRTLYQRSNKPSSELLKKTVALQKKLSPSSEFHDERSVIDLQHTVLKVKSVVKRLDNIPGSIGTRNQIKEPWNRGWKWIFEN